MPQGTPLGYLPPDIQRQLLGSLIGQPMPWGGAGMLVPPVIGVAPAAPAMSFMGQSVAAPQPTHVQGGRTMAQMSIKELNQLLLDPRLKGDQARRNKVSAMIQQKQLAK